MERTEKTTSTDLIALALLVEFLHCRNVPLDANISLGVLCLHIFDMALSFVLESDLQISYFNEFAIPHYLPPQVENGEGEYLSIPSC